MDSPNSRPAPWQITVILAIGMIAASTAAILIRLAFDAAGHQGVAISLVLAASRLIFSALLIVPAWRGIHAIAPSRPAILFSMAAGLSLALHFAAWITSLSYTSIAASTALVTTNPIWVALVAYVWFREIPSRQTLWGMGMAIAGSFIITLGSTTTPLSSAPHPLLGNGLALLGAWAVSFYLLCGREAQRRGLQIGHHLAITYTTAAVILSVMPLAIGASYTAYPQAVYVYIILMAIFPQLIGHSSFNWAVRWISPTLVTLTILAEPIGAGILGFLVFREQPGMTVIIGAGVILLGVAIAALGAPSRSSSRPNAS
jgi:drug/metabolite transporter (DMT)-like permease